MSITFNEESKEKLDYIRKKEEEDLAMVLSQKYGIGFANLTAVNINAEALGLVPEEEARQSEIAVFQKKGNVAHVALRTPNSSLAQKSIRELEQRGFKVVPYMVSHASLEHAWEHYKDLSFAVQTEFGVLTVSEDAVAKLRDTLTTFAKIQDEIVSTLALKQQYRVTRILEIVIGGALANKASDVHIEPRERTTQLRFRIDGVLVDIANIELDTYFAMLTRIKLLSGLKINIKNAPQDGRFSMHVGKAEIEIRTSVLPGGYGESVVMRLLDPHTIGVPLEELGILPKLLEALQVELRKPNGMILNTGPTGSGKTTTLYAFLKQVMSPDIKVLTIEDPIEYHLEGIVQTQVNKKGYTFASGLRSALRQDPDVIMVGEIRDTEVAETAVHAALTGHLVFSTLHTNNAAGAFPRLLDMGVQPSMAGSSVNVVMAQRLLRRLDPLHKREVKLEGKDLAFVESILKGIHNQSQIPKNVNTVWVPEEVTNDLVYKGRIGVYEAIFTTREIEQTIRKNLTTREIEDVAKEQGFLSMKEDAVIKVLQGITTLDEVRRVLGEESVENGSTL